MDGKGWFIFPGTYWTISGINTLSKGAFEILFYVWEKKMPLRTEQKLRVTNAECENATYSFCNASGNNNTMEKKNTEKKICFPLNSTKVWIPRSGVCVGSDGVHEKWIHGRLFVFSHKDRWKTSWMGDCTELQGLAEQTWRRNLSSSSMIKLTVFSRTGKKKTTTNEPTKIKNKLTTTNK